MPQNQQTAGLGDISAQLSSNDTNTLLASILLELRTQNIMLLNAFNMKDEPADIRNALTIADFTDQSS